MTDDIPESAIIRSRPAGYARSGSDLEAAMAFVLKVAGVPEPVREYEFAPPRRWRADFAWPDLMIAVEVEGGSWNGGRHVHGDGFERDCEKYNELAARGWRLFRFTGRMVEDGSALAMLERVIGGAR